MADKTEKNVYALIAAVSADLAKIGISKDSKNVQQGYQFRGIDAVYNALAPIISKHGLVIIPRVLTRECVERKTVRDTTLFSVTVEAEFDFVSIHDTSIHTARMFGEAMDSGDKATNKAESAAYKYVCFQVFCIPTEGAADTDADATTHDEVKAEPLPPQFAEKWADLQAVADNGMKALTDTWAKHDKPLKKYIQEHHKAQWEKTKARAEAVDKKRAAVAVPA